MVSSSPIAPCLWFDHQAEEAAEFYTGIFPNSAITQVARYAESEHETHRGRAGTVMTVEFVLSGQRFTALNGGPMFSFSEAISFQIMCESQEELDRYWDALSAGGDPAAQQCGWLKDRYGVSWQVVPTALAALLGEASSDQARRVTEALLKMKRLDIAALQRAYDGQG